MSNFLQRLILGSIVSAIILITIFFSHEGMMQLIFVFLASGIICGSLWEYYHISKMNQGKPADSIGILGSLFYILALYFSLQNPSLADLPLITVGLILICAFLSYFYTGMRMSPFFNLAVTMFGVIYITVPLACVIPINFTYGRMWLVYLLFVTKLTDVGAYLIGKQMGIHKMAPIISPKKTWEGAIGGFLVGTLTSYAFHKFSLFYFGQGLFSSSLHSLWLGGLMSVVAQIGDLSESLLKRDTGVKDSNRLPGLGGLLDMVDSLIFTTPLLYFFLKLFWAKT